MDGERREREEVREYARVCSCHRLEREREREQKGIQRAIASAGVWTPRAGARAERGREAGGRQLHAAAQGRWPADARELLSHRGGAHSLGRDRPCSLSPAMGAQAVCGHRQRGGVGWKPLAPLPRGGLFFPALGAAPRQAEAGEKTRERKEGLSPPPWPPWARVHPLSPLPPHLPNR